MKIHVVTEGMLEKPVAHRLIAFCHHSCGTVYPLNGAGNIANRVAAYAALADEATAVLVLTDFMDSQAPCPSAAKQRYLGKKARTLSPHFLLRFAVNELESWLLADHKNFSKLLGVPAGKIAPEPDMLSDPKRHIAELARLSRQKAIRNDLVSASGRQGRLYLPKMEKFIRDQWDIEAAMSRSPSLSRCIARLGELDSI